MELNEIQVEKEKLLQEIADIVSEIQKIINENKESFDEKDYKKAKELMRRCDKVGDTRYRLNKTKENCEYYIDSVNMKKEKYPLVPIEDINPDFQKYKEMVKEIEDLIEDFNNSVEKYNLLELHEKLEKMVDEYEKKVKKEKKEQARKEIKEELEKILKEPKDFKGKGIKLTISNPFLNKYGDDVFYSHDKEVKFLSGGIYELYKRFGDMSLQIFRKKSVTIKGEDTYHNSSETFTTYRSFESIFDFTPYEECKIEEKQKCKEVEAKLEEIKNSSEEKYDEPKEIEFYIGRTKDVFDFDDKIKLSVTQRELANAGILPEELGWEKKTKVSSKNIAEADREQALTTTEVGGFKGFMKRLLDKFKGKGEK